MAKRIKNIHIQEHGTDGHAVYTDLTKHQLSGIEGVALVSELYCDEGFFIVRVDKRYKEVDVLNEIKVLAQEQVEWRGK